jgi:hypothetical protein
MRGKLELGRKSLSAAVHRGCKLLPLLPYAYDHGSHLMRRVGSGDILERGPVIKALSRIKLAAEWGIAKLPPSWTSNTQLDFGSNRRRTKTFESS